MIFIPDYTALGITDIVMLKSESYPGRHDYSQDRTYHELAAKRGGKCFRTRFSWFEPHKLRPGQGEHARGHSETGTQEISEEEYDVLLKQHGLWGAPIPSPDNDVPACSSCGLPMGRRTNRRTGSQFWGCRDYPRCRGTKR